MSLALVLVMTVLLLSGSLLLYSSFRALKLFNRLIHGQMFMTALLIILIILHVSSGE